MCRRSDPTPRKGFTLVDLAVVIVILGVLAAFGVPRFITASERSTATEAFSYLSAVRGAQERYHARNGSYASTIANLDVRTAAPRHFVVGDIAAGSTGRLADSWSLTLMRQGSPAAYGAYTVTYTEDGFDRPNSSIANLPTINPMGT